MDPEFLADVEGKLAADIVHEHKSNLKKKKRERMKYLRTQSEATIKNVRIKSAVYEKKALLPTA